VAAVIRGAVVLAALTLAPVAAAGEGEGTWWPDGIVCDATGDCRYVAPGCELVRVMDDQGELAGTRRVLFCKAPRNAV
jgi:hypothetical protein